MISATQMEYIKDLIKIYQSLEALTKEVSGENYITASMIIPLINCVKKNLQDFTPLTDVGEKTKTLILQNIKKRFGSIEHVNILAICTILDPRFKKIHFNDKIACSQIIREITDMLHGDVTKDITHTNSKIIEENESSLWSFYKKLMNQNQSDQQITCNEEKGMELRII